MCVMYIFYLAIPLGKMLVHTYNIRIIFLVRFYVSCATKLHAGYDYASLAHGRGQAFY